MNSKKQSPMSRIWELAKSQHGKLKKSVLLAILGVASGFIPYYSAAQIIILLLNHTANMDNCLPWILLALIGSILKVLFASASTSISHVATFSVLQEVRNKCMHKLSKLSMGTLQEQSIGNFKSIIVERIESMEKTLAHLLPEMTSNALAPVGLLIILLIIDWRMAIVSIVTFPIGMMFMISVMKTYPKKYEESVQIGKNMNDAILEYINGIEVIKAFNQGKKSYAKYENAVNDNASFFYNWMKSCQIPMSAYKTICPAVLISVLPVGFLFFINGSLTSSNFITIVILSLGIIGPIMEATNYIDSLAQTGTIIDDIGMILNAREQEHPNERAELNGTDIKLDNVSFAYQREYVLKNINLTIEKGSMTALVGPSGSGKSTITKLIAGFWDVKEGMIYIGGKNIREIPLSQIAENIAYVSQDNYLFNDTIRENIRMGKETATDKEVEMAAKAAGCDGFIRKLENGYDTNVGGGGGHLSGGERQRIAIARAMLKDAPIVILDEATAYIDPENEAIIQKAVGKLVKGKTLIMIAHRLSTIVDADNIVLVKDGRIDNTGTHKELLQKSKLYKTMWEAHIGAKEGE